MDTQRTAVLQRFGFDSNVVDRLMTVLSRELPTAFPNPSQFPLGNQLFVPDWITCCMEAKRQGTVAALRNMLFELNFPISEGISAAPEYREPRPSGRLGGLEIWKKHALGEPTWEAPDLIRIFLHDTGGGLIPVIRTGVHADFATILRAIMHANNPVPVASSMGSSFIRGYQNKRRYLGIREALAMGVIAPESRDPQLWKDQFILLSSGDYSGVPASSMELDSAAWLELSTRIRLHHESCHYIIRRLFPRLRFGLQDELIADFAGLMQVRGNFKAAEFMLFMGLEDFPAYRSGGRLENYPRELEGGKEVSQAVGFLLVEASKHLESFFATWDPLRFQQEKLRVLAILTWLPLEVLASPESGQVLEEMLALAGTSSI
jgi:hypothetical protein